MKSEVWKLIVDALQADGRWEIIPNAGEGILVKNPENPGERLVVPELRVIDASAYVSPWSTP